MLFLQQRVSLTMPMWATSVHFDRRIEERGILMSHTHLLTDAIGWTWYDSVYKPLSATI